MEDDCQFDAFGYHVNRPFSTRDQENDNHVSDHCAVDYEGMFINGSAMLNHF